jgi:hypothetical protein
MRYFLPHQFSDSNDRIDAEDSGNDYRQEGDYDERDIGDEQLEICFQTNEQEGKQISSQWEPW